MIRNRIFLDSVRPRRRFETGGSSDNDLIDFIIQEEGFLDKPTNIGDGKITIGSGLTDKRWIDLYKKRGNKWSKEDNRFAVGQEVANRRKWAETNVPYWSELPDTAQKALLSYKYNYDFNERNSPLMYKALRAKDYDTVALEMNATNKNPKFAKGLAARRKREQDWFKSGFEVSQVKPVLEQQDAPQDNTRYLYAPQDNTSINNSIRKFFDATIPKPLMQPIPNRYVKVSYSPEYQVQQNALNALHRLGNMIRYTRDSDWMRKPAPLRFYNYDN